MSLIIPDSGEIEMLKRILNLSTPDNLTLHLFTNDVNVKETTRLGELTECNKSGYSSVILTESGWATSGSPTEASHKEKEFTILEAVSIYGYYITNTAGTVLMFVERFVDGPYTLPENGGSIYITPKIQLS